MIETIEELYLDEFPSVLTELEYTSSLLLENWAEDIKTVASNRQATGSNRDIVPTEFREKSFVSCLGRIFF